MLIPIRCFSCNNIIGDKFEYFIKETTHNKETKDNKEILDKLELTRICCRRHMISTVDLMNII